MILSQRGEATVGRVALALTISGENFATVENVTFR